MVQGKSGFGIFTASARLLGVKYVVSIASMFPFAKALGALTKMGPIVLAGA